MTTAVCGALLAAAQAGPALAQAVSPPTGGQAHWVDTPEGRLKTRLYDSGAEAMPILVVVVHGDVPNPRLDYHYYFARMAAEGRAGFDAIPGARDAFPALGAYFDMSDWSGGLAAAGLLRPGYSDVDGDRSDGEMGAALADNYTPEVVDAVAAATFALRTDTGAAKVVLIGHSGGAAIAADVLARHPEAADAALLIACGCDPAGWRAAAREGAFRDMDWSHPYRSLSPLDAAADVPADAIVRMLVGAADDVVGVEPTEAYAGLLSERGVDASVTIVPGAGHDDIMFSAEAFAALGALVADLRAGD